MINSEILIGLPEYQITGIERKNGWTTISARYVGAVCCPWCGGSKLRSKGVYTRQVRHEDWGRRRCVLELEARKWRCLDCKKGFRQRFPGIGIWQRASEAFQETIYRDHLDGINRSRLGQREAIGSATVERYFKRRLRKQFGEWHPAECPRVLGIDEHFFTRRQGYVTTLCDLKNHKVYDVVLGRSAASLESYMEELKGKEKVQVVCMDLAAVYRALAQKYFPQARIVADRFHVIRLINQHFMACWRELDPEGAKNRGLISLIRRHRHNLKPEQKPRLMDYLKEHEAIGVVYRFKQRLCYLLLKKHRTRKQCEKLIRRFLTAVEQLRGCGLAQLVQLGETLHSWSAEIVTMWRFTRSNGITEGFHTKMEVLQRQAYGFRNFQNYRMRVKVVCC